MVHNDILLGFNEEFILSLPTLPRSEHLLMNSKDGIGRLQGIGDSNSSCEAATRELIMVMR
jgi:hypothetical protein